MSTLREQRNRTPAQPVDFLDLFPAMLTHSSGDGTKARRSIRAYLANGVLRVFEAATPKPRLVLEVEATTANPAGFRRFEVPTADGEKWILEAQAGDCGCRNPLKNFDPRTWTP